MASSTRPTPVSRSSVIAATEARLPSLGPPSRSYFASVALSAFSDACRAFHES